MLPAILGLSGLALTADEIAFFKEAEPAGFILFARNCGNRGQLRALTDSLRALSGRDELPILIDQEGGRVARMKPPEWPAFPAGWRFAELYEKAPISAIEAARATRRALVMMLSEAGINVDCLPRARRSRGGQPRRDRRGRSAASRSASQRVGRAVLDGLEAGGCAGVGKHMRATAAPAPTAQGMRWSRRAPRSWRPTCAPFRALRDAPMGMTAHLLFTAWDEERPASISPTIVGEIIRGEIGFDGLLMSDDLAMQALTGTPGERAAAALAAGTDLALYCSGVIEENESLAGALGGMSEAATERLARAMARTGKGEGDMAELAAKRDALLAYA